MRHECKNFRPGVALVNSYPIGAICSLPTVVRLVAVHKCADCGKSRQKGGG